MNVKGFILRLFLASCLFAVVPSCASREDLEELEQRVDELGREVDQLNLLVQQINGGGYVVAVIPDEDGNGYTLAFNDGSSVHINIAAKSGGNSSQGEGHSGSSAQSSGGGITFSSVDTSNPDYVVIILSDGSVLRLPTWAAFDALQQQVKQLNINLSALSRIVSALKDNDYLLSMSPFVENGIPVGWLLNFSRSGLVVIYSSGASATPQIGVRQDSDGVYYWTMDGEWLLDSEGRKVRAQGANGADAVAPRIKIEEGFWWISYDDGTTWTQLGKATGEDGDSFFREVDQSNEEYVRLVLADGDAILIPRYVQLDIQLSLPSEMVMGLLETWRIPYTIIGTNKENASLAVFGQDGLSAGVSDDGTIYVSTSDSHGGSFLIMLSVPSGTTVMKSFKIEGRRIRVESDSFYMTTIPSSEAVANVKQEGGQLYLHCVANSSFGLDLSQLPWVTLDRCIYYNGGYEIYLHVEPNNDTTRSGRMFFTFDDPGWNGAKSYEYGNDVSRYYVTISQDGAGSGHIMRDVIEAQACSESMVYEIEVESSADALSAWSESPWISCTMEKKTQKLWTLYVTVDGYSGPTERRAQVFVSEAGQVIGSLSVIQKDLCLDEEAMVKMRVVALPENNYNVMLPFTGELSLRVDWGDGCVSIFERGLNNSEKPFRHKYKETGDERHYVVSAIGKMRKMSSSTIYEYVTVESVLQWGADLGLTSMASAFYFVKTLKSVAEDKHQVFSEVTTFTSAFQSCSALEEVPVNLFDAAYMATRFDKTFAQVTNVTTESPYAVIDGQKVHLYERDGYGPYFRVTSYAGCFSSGNWADKEAIRLAGWN